MVFFPAFEVWNVVVYEHNIVVLTRPTTRNKTLKNPVGYFTILRLNAAFENA